MPYGDSPAGLGGSASALLRIDWKSALFGGAVMMTAAYVGVMRPASRQITALERQVNRLAVSVESLNESRDGVARTTSLLGRIDEQAARLGAAEAAVIRFEALGSRLEAQADAVLAAGETLEAIEAMHVRMAAGGAALDEMAAAVDDMDALAIQVKATKETAQAAVSALATVNDQLKVGSARLTAAGLAANRLTGFVCSLAERKDETDAAVARLGRLTDLEDRLIQSTTDLAAADTAISRLADISGSLSEASDTLGQLQRFVVDIVLLEPTFNRAVRALEPVVEFTAAGRRLEVKAVRDDTEAERETKGTTIREVARVAGDEGR